MLNIHRLKHNVSPYFTKLWRSATILIDQSVVTLYNDLWTWPRPSSVPVLCERGSWNTYWSTCGPTLMLHQLLWILPPILHHQLIGHALSSTKLSHPHKLVSYETIPIMIFEDDRDLDLVQFYTNPHASEGGVDMLLEHLLSHWDTAPIVDLLFLILFHPFETEDY